MVQMALGNCIGGLRLEICTTLGLRGVCFHIGEPGAVMAPLLGRAELAGVLLSSLGPSVYSSALGSPF